MNPRQPLKPYYTNIYPKYRSDIDGLRALAVILVVIFHAFPEWLPGGFIGVDIFFVISGFLISSILLENLKENRFSFLDFYLRRIRRIFPALLAVLIFSISLGWITLYADEYRLLGRHVLSSASFIQNFNLLSEVDYFDEAANTKPLLHLWSLGIEEQFYIIWPMMLWMAYRLRINFLIFIIFIALSSFIFNLANVYTNPTFAFFSPLSRFWELLIGAILADLMLREDLKSYLPKNLSLLGFGLILIGSIFIRPTSNFPGWLALVPCMGAFCIIASNQEGFINRHLLSNRAMVALGLISYPLYLWHWVLLSFARITESGELQWSYRLIIVVISVPLAVMTYLFIEKPIQATLFKKYKIVALIILMTFVAFIGQNIYLRDGLAFRPINTNYLDIIALNQAGDDEAKRPEGFIEGFSCKYFEDNCPPLVTSNKRILVWGDSHAQMLAYGLKKNLPINWQFLLITRPGCKPEIITKSEQSESDCAKINFYATQQIKFARPEIVLLAQRDAWDSSQVDLLFDELEKMGVKKVLYLGKSPEWHAKLPKIMSRQNAYSIRRYSKASLNLENLQLNSAARGNFHGGPSKQYIDLIDILCNGDGCLTYIGNDLTTGLTSLDSNHLSPAASDFVAKELLIKHLE